MGDEKKDWTQIRRYLSERASKSGPKDAVSAVRNASEEYHRELMWSGLGVAGVSYLVWGVGVQETGNAVEPMVDDNLLNPYLEYVDLTTDEAWNRYVEESLETWKEVGNTNANEVDNAEEAWKAPMDKIGHFLVGRSLVSATYETLDQVRERVGETTDAEFNYSLENYAPFGGLAVGGFMTGKELGIEGLTVVQVLNTGDALGDWIMDVAGAAEATRVDEKQRYEEGDAETHGEYLPRLKSRLQDQLSDSSNPTE